VEKKIFRVKANNVDFYCEMQGEGPVVVLIPEGSNDCGQFIWVAEILEKNYTVLTFDCRGSQRSKDLNPNPEHVTPKMLADDAAAIIRSLNIDKVSVWGCSSGGQAALSLGKYYPDLCRNVMVHEAALQQDAPLPNAGFEFFKNIETFNKAMDKTKLVIAPLVAIVGNYDAWKKIGIKYKLRAIRNRKFWSKYYLGTVDQDSYSADDFKAMPPTTFTVGTFTPSWVVYANIETAKRGNCECTWINSAHSPQITCPEVVAAEIDRRVKENL